MQQVRSKDGTTIAFDRSGKGPAVILVGGALSDRAAARPLTALLNKHFTVVAYDRRGRGDSGDTPPNAVEREVEDIGALIKAAGGSAFVYGHSSGGLLALEAAAAGLSIPRLAVYEPPYILDAGRSQQVRDYMSQLAELVATGEYGPAVELFLTRVVMTPADMVAQMRSTPIWGALAKMAPTLLNDLAIMYNAIRDPSLSTRQWASISQPALVMDGQLSPPWMRNAVQTVAAALPNTTYRTLAGQTHGADPALVAPVLIGFFEGRLEAEPELEVAIQGA